MAFDNVTLFEITVEDPFASGPDELESPASTAESATSDEGGGRGLGLLALVVAGTVLGLAAIWLARRRGADDDYETEAVEPGVERVEA